LPLSRPKSAHIKKERKEACSEIPLFLPFFSPLEKYSLCIGLEMKKKRERAKEEKRGREGKRSLDAISLNFCIPRTNSRGRRRKGPQMLVFLIPSILSVEK